MHFLFSLKNARSKFNTQILFDEILLISSLILDSLALQVVGEMIVLIRSQNRVAYIWLRTRDAFSYVL